MFDSLRNLRLDVKIALLGAGSVLATAIALVALAVWQSGRYNSLAQDEVQALIEADLDHIAHGIYNLVKTENEAAQDQVDRSLAIARQVLKETGEVALTGKTVTWTAVNQFTGRESRV